MVSLMTHIEHALQHDHDAVASDSSLQRYTTYTMSQHSEAIMTLVYGVIPNTLDMDESNFVPG
jgi:hypothetical protein